MCLCHSDLQLAQAVSSLQERYEPPKLVNIVELVTKEVSAVMFKWTFFYYFWYVELKPKVYQYLSETLYIENQSNVKKMKLCTIIQNGMERKMIIIYYNTNHARSAKFPTDSITVICI
jgi:hypothetical protein